MGFLSTYKYPIIFFIIMGISFYSGWKVNSYYVGYQQNLEKIVQDSINKSVSDFQRQQAQGLEDTKKLLDGVKTNTIYKERTIVNKPIYLNGCMDEEGVNLLREYKNESSNIINKKGSSK